MPQPQVLSFEDALANHAQTAPSGGGVVSFDDALASAGQSADIADTPKQWSDMTPDEQKTLVAQRQPQAKAQADANMPPVQKAPEGSAVRRFATNFGQVIDPRNIVHAVAHPYDTAVGMVGAQLDQGKQALSDLKTAWNTDDKTTAVRALGHGIAAVTPIAGPIAAEAGNQIASGDYAGGLGKAAGLAVGGEVADMAKDATGIGVRKVVNRFKPNLAEDLMASAANDRVMAKTPTAHPIDTVDLAATAAAAAHPVAAGVAETANMVRKSPMLKSAKAYMKEGAAKWLTQDQGTGPSTLEIPDDAEQVVPEQQPSVKVAPRFAKEEHATTPATGELADAQKTRLADEAATEADLSAEQAQRQPAPQPGEAPRNPEIDRFLSELRHETEAQRRFDAAKEKQSLDWDSNGESDTGSPYPWEQQEKANVSRPEPQPIPTRDEMGMTRQNPLAGLEQGIAPVGLGKERIIRKPRGNPSIIEELDRIAPHLKDIPKGEKFDEALYQEFKNKTQGVIDADNNTSDDTPVDKKPIIEHWQNMEDDYASRGLGKQAGAMQKLIDKWNALPEQIPYNAFRDWKRAFFGETDTGMMRRAYRALSDASSKVSPELAKANREYYLTRSALEAGKIEITTGRRISKVGTVPKPTKRF